MDTSELAKRFISKAPKFYEDLELHDIDKKHSKIVKQAYEEVERGSAFVADNFRNWKEHNDSSVPGQISLGAIKCDGLFLTLARYVYKKFINRVEDEILLSTFVDDISVIKSIGAEELLMENPVHLTPGATLFHNIDGTSVNLRWLRYIYLLKRILDMGVLKEGAVWVDVGSFYGGLQGLVHKYNSESRIVMVDFHHQLCRSFIYLSKLLFPKVLLSTCPCQIMKVLPDKQLTSSLTFLVWERCEESFLISI
jgi:putative sugar O-methyltransferase